jgi:3-dehydroquinate synthase
MADRSNLNQQTKSNTSISKQIESVSIDTKFSLEYVHRLRFTSDVFNPYNLMLLDILKRTDSHHARVVVFADSGVIDVQSGLIKKIQAYAETFKETIKLVGDVQVIAGGEVVKNNTRHLKLILRAINEFHICRRSYIIVIGGGAVLDLVGFAAAIAHRGVRLIRMGTTTLAQTDSAMGVKNGINAFGKKNYLGVFATPWAVINDEATLKTLSDRDWISGFSEAVKVALLKDAKMFEEICENAFLIRERRLEASIPIIRRSAQLHFDHITLGGDPFELNEARPLDFGHWAAHKLEHLTDYEIRHGEAVAIGIAMDVTYSNLMGWLNDTDHQRILNCLTNIGFKLFHPVMNASGLMMGLEEFQEHLGGNLTIPMLRKIGDTFDVHEIVHEKMRAAISYLENRFWGCPIAGTILCGCPF